jgi:hypothetical protein
MTGALLATGRKRTSGVRRGRKRSGQRMADYYARLTKQQEERENNEAQERFAASQRKKRGGSKPE